MQHDRCSKDGRDERALGPRQDPEALIQTKELQHLLGGVSHMFIRRKLESDPDFPRPIRLTEGGRRFWRRGEALAYIERRRAAGGPRR